MEESPSTPSSPEEDEAYKSAVYVLASLAESYKGRDARRIIDIIAEKGEITDSEISEILGMDENEVRRIIWVLAGEGLVSSKRVTSDTGWITFYWVLPINQVDGILISLYKKIIDRLETKLEYESNNVFYWCMTEGHDRYTFSEAADLMFKCPVCGKTLMPYDNSKLIAALSWAISEMKKILNNYFKEEEIEEEVQEE
jgi:transcription initiation factor TFIIE subunit alpha